MFRRTKTKSNHKQRFRIFAKHTDYLIADIWAASDDEANRIAGDHDGGDYRIMTGEWEIEEVREIKDEDLIFESFQPLN